MGRDESNARDNAESSPSCSNTKKNGGERRDDSAQNSGQTMKEEKKDWIQLSEYVHTLLDEGKRGGHSDFQILFKIFGKEKITEIAKKYLENKKSSSMVQKKEDDDG